MCQIMIPVIMSLCGNLRINTALNELVCAPHSVAASIVRAKCDQCHRGGIPGLKKINRRMRFMQEHLTYHLDLLPRHLEWNSQEVICCIPWTEQRRQGTWYWNEEVQDSIKRKKSANKWHENRQEYLEARCKAKKGLIVNCMWRRTKDLYRLDSQRDKAHGWKCIKE